MSVPALTETTTRADGIDTRPVYEFGVPQSFTDPAAAISGPTFDITDFGAIADPNIDNRPMIQAAINAAHAAGGGIVVIPEGTFGIKADPDGYGSIHVLSNVYVQGAGMGDSVLRLVDGHEGTVTGLVRSPWGEETTNWGIADLTIDGNKSNTSGQVDGFFTGPEPGQTIADQDVTVMRVEIENVSRYGFDPHELTERLTIQNSVAHDNAVDGFVLDMIVEANIVGNESYDNGRHGFNVVTTSQDLLFTDNVSHDNSGAGFVVQRGSEIIESPSIVTFTGGSSYGNGREGVLVQFSDHVTVEGMEIYENGRQGVRLYGSSDSLVQNNDIHNNSQSKDEGYSEVEIEAYAPSNPGPGNLAYEAAGNTITDNSINASGDVLARYGIEVIGQTPEDNSISIDDIKGMARGAYLAEDGDAQWVYAEAKGGDLIGTSQNDVLLGSRSADYINAKNNDDIAFGEGGKDTMRGGKGADELHGGDGNDSIRGDSGNDKLFGEDGNDKLNGNSGDDMLNGGAGKDLISGGSGNDTIEGNSGNDALFGDGGNDSLYGNSGNDVLDGGAGDDRISGGSGNDYIYASTGSDTYDGDGELDTLDFSRIDSGVTINASKKNATGPVSLTFDSIETFIGSNHDDSFRGSDRAQAFEGGSGNDVIRGAGGVDTLSGGEGNDVFQYARRDIIDEHGNHRGADLITDYEVGDVIDLTDIGRNDADGPRLVESENGMTVMATIGGKEVAIAELEGVTSADQVTFGSADSIFAA